MTAELPVLFGAGQVGSQLTDLLLQAGKRVRVVRRSAGAVPPGVELLLGDAADPALCNQAANGSSTVYHCMNPPYYAKIWANLVPRYMENLITAAARGGSRSA